MAAKSIVSIVWALICAVCMGGQVAKGNAFWSAWSAVFMCLNLDSGLRRG